MSDEAENDGHISDLTVEADADSAPRIEPGEYQARVVRGETKMLFKTRRLVLLMEIMQSKAAGTRLRFMRQAGRRGVVRPRGDRGQGREVSRVRWRS